MSRRTFKAFACLIAAFNIAIGFLPPIDVASGFCWGVAAVYLRIGVLS